MVTAERISPVDPHLVAGPSCIKCHRPGGGGGPAIRGEEAWGGRVTGRRRPLLRGAPTAENDAWAGLAVLCSGGTWGEP
jgi:mono/diheme cytochrome c family protein